MHNLGREWFGRQFFVVPSSSTLAEVCSTDVVTTDSTLVSSTGAVTPDSTSPASPLGEGERTKSKNDENSEL